jgi:hypothetical protein
LPASAFTPLAANGVIVMFSSTDQQRCSLQAFDPATLLPLWEEDAAGAFARVGLTPDIQLPALAKPAFYHADLRDGNFKPGVVEIFPVG